MFYDFRHGDQKWPKGVEVIQPEEAKELIEVARDAAIKLRDKDKEKEKKDGGAVDMSSRIHEMPDVKIGADFKMWDS